MAIERLGEGQDMAKKEAKGHSEPDDGVKHKPLIGLFPAWYVEPSHSAERRPIHPPTKAKHQELYDFVQDVEAHDPKYVVHSAEQLPLMAQHAFLDRQHEADKRAVYHDAYPKYHAKGSPHAHADFV